MVKGQRWIIFKVETHWVVARRDTRSHIHGLPYKTWLRTRTGAEAIAVFNNPSLQTTMGWYAT